jgi:hypothetical protein
MTSCNEEVGICLWSSQLTANAFYVKSLHLYISISKPSSVSVDFIGKSNKKKHGHFKTPPSAILVAEVTRFEALL